MDSIVVIGLGRFGFKLARNLAAGGVDVIAIDKDRDAVERISADVAEAIAMDATDEQTVRDRGLHRAGSVVIAMGSDFESSVLMTITLKQLGVERVIARARSTITARVLRRVGADAVILPEDEAADRWSNRLIGPTVLNQIEFHEGYSVAEVLAPRSWVGKTLIELDVRARHNLHVVAVKRRDAAATTSEKTPKGVFTEPTTRDKSPSESKPSTTSEAQPTAQPQGGPGAIRVEMLKPNEPIEATDVLVLMGRDEDIAGLPQS